MEKQNYDPNTYLGLIPTKDEMNRRLEVLAKAKKIKRKVVFLPQGFSHSYQELKNKKQKIWYTYRY